MKKFLCVLFAAIMMLCVFSACNNSDDGARTTGESSGDFYISADALSSYTITHADICTKEMVNSAKTLKSAIKTAYGSELNIGDDFHREGYNEIPEYEILIGKTERPESLEFLSNMKYNDYGYAIINKKLIIAGHTDETTIMALDHFIENVLSSRSETTFFSNKNQYLHKEEYPLNSIKLNGVEISKYTIVYSYSHRGTQGAFANKLQQEIIDLSGHCLNIKNDKEDYADQYELIIGDSSHISDTLRYEAGTGGLYTLADDEYLIATEGKKVWLTAGSASGTLAVIDAFIKKITPDSGTLNSDIMINTNEISKFSEDLTASAMSFNVYIGNITSERIERVTKMIKNYMPDTFGVQEADITWINAISEALPEYAYVGEGRDGGGTNGEYSAVFYRKDKFDLIDGGTKWLSDTPDVKGSKYEESNCVRVMSYAVLEKKSDGTRFIHVNTHLDHISSEAREKQTDVLLAEIAKLPDYPVILTGDFNCEAGSAPINDITGNFDNAGTKANTASTGPTYHGYEGKTKIIDFVFFSTGRFSIEQYKVCNEMIDGAYASDHHPVYTEYVLIN